MSGHRAHAPIGAGTTGGLGAPATRPADPLMRGAYSLMASTVVTSLLGVAFWIAAARLYPASEVGRDSTLIAAMMALSGICQLNAANAIPRFLPQVRDPARALRLAYLASAVAAVALAVPFVLIVPRLVDDLGAVGEQPALAAGFVLATVLWGAFGIQDAALTAVRRSEWVPAENAAYGLLKLVALPLMVAVGAGYGIFQSWVLPTILLIVPVTLFLFRSAIPAHVRKHAGSGSALRRAGVLRFLAQDYGASTVAFVATAALPLLVLALLGSREAAYFAIAYVLVRCLDLLATNAGTSVTVESAFDEGKLHAHARRIVRRLLPFMVGASAAVVVAAPLVLLPFGAEYAREGTTVLRLLGAAVVFRCATVLFRVVCRGRRRGGALLALDAFLAVLVLGLTVALAPPFGLTGVGLAWLAANAVAAAVVLPGLVAFMRHGDASEGEAEGPGRVPRERPFRPTWVTERELDGPVAELDPPSREGAPYGRVRVLVRLRGRPLGFVEMPLPQEGVSAEAFLRVAASRLRAEILRHRAEPAGPLPGPRSFVSVIVCTHDRPQGLRAALRSLLDQTHAPFEVVVVDNAPSTDEVRRVVAALADPRLRYVLEPRPGLSLARNVGARAARGAIVAYTDDDVEVDRDWLRWIVAAFGRAPRVGVVTGLVPTAALETRSQAIFDARIGWADRLEPRLYDLGPNDPGTRFFPYSAGVFGTGANCAFRAETLRELGYFDERLGPPNPTLGGEDLDMFLRVLRAGWTLAYEPAAIVWHFHRADERALAYQIRAYGSGLGAYAAKHIAARDTGPEIARLVPAALWRLVTERHSSAGGQTVPLKLRAQELRGVLPGAAAYVRLRRAGPHPAGLGVREQGAAVDGPPRRRADQVEDGGRHVGDPPVGEVAPGRGARPAHGDEAAVDVAAGSPERHRPDAAHGGAVDHVPDPRVPADDEVRVR
jgi:GT2 family glycosyltransferase/O-antigen/teichoic acid export membrane protein